MQVTTLLERLRSAPSHEYQSIGGGTHVRLGDDHLAAGGLVARGRLVHLAAFIPSDACGQASERLPGPQSCVTVARKGRQVFRLVRVLVAAVLFAFAGCAYGLSRVARGLERLRGDA
jgi:hypothetical protein